MNEGDFQENIPLENLEEVLNNPEKYLGPKGKFRPHAYYNKWGCHIHAIWENKPIIGKWINKYLTLFFDRSEKARDRIIGVELTSLESLIKNNMIKIWWEDKPYTEDPMTNNLTLYRDKENKKRVIGVEIDNVKELIQESEK